MLERQLIVIALALLAAAEAPQEIAYCTDVGPVRISIEGDVLRAHYEISRKKISGTITARLNGNMATGRWSDPAGTGRIFIMAHGRWQSRRDRQHLIFFPCRAAKLRDGLQR